MRRSTTARLLAAATSVGLGTLVMPSGALAHTDVDYTLPTDGAAVGEPIDEITVAFTQPVTLVGNGFEVLEPDGDIVEPFAATDDDTVFLLQLDAPLAGGAVGVRYEVTSQDGHVVSGAFSFEVAAAPATTTTAAPATTGPPPAEPTPTAAEEAEIVAEPEPEVASTLPPTTTVAPAATSEAPPSTLADDASAAEPEQPATEAAAGVDEVGGDDGGSGTGPIIVVIAAIGLAALGFLVVRSRMSG